MAMLRVLLIVGALGALTAWVVATGVPGTDGRQGSPAGAAASGARDARSAPTPDRGRDLDVEVSRLRAGLASMPVPSALGRNPFRFARPDRHAEPTAATDGGSAPDDGSTEAAAALDRSVLRLIGIAEDTAGGQPVRTAVIATPRQLYLVREGEQIALRFLVTGISADAVELQDLATDSTLRLPLR